MDAIELGWKQRVTGDHCTHAISLMSSTLPLVTKQNAEKRLFSSTKRVVNFVFGCSRCNCCHFFNWSWLLCVGNIRGIRQLGRGNPHLEEPCQLRGWYTEGTRVLEPPKNAASLVVCQRFFFPTQNCKSTKTPMFHAWLAECCAGC